MHGTIGNFNDIALVAAVLVASTAVLGFSQSVSATKSGHSAESGVLVISVAPGSPADKAGLARGDIILDTNGSAVNNPRDLQEAISSRKRGDTISLTVLHGDAQKTLSVVLGGSAGQPYLGTRLLPDERERTSMVGPGHVDWSRELSEGAFITKVATASAAYKAGIRDGDAILSVDGVLIDSDHSLSQLISAKKIGEMVTLSVRSRQESMYKAPEELKITLGSAPDGKTPWLGVEYRMSFPAAYVAPWDSFPRVVNFLKGVGMLHTPAPTA
jgi:S1-C subfamily serine protease